MQITQSAKTAALSEADFFKTPNVVSKRVLQYGGEAVIRVEVEVFADNGARDVVEWTFTRRATR